MTGAFETSPQSIHTWLERIPNAEWELEQSTTTTRKRRRTGSPSPSPLRERSGISALRKRPRISNGREPFTHTTGSKDSYMADGVFPTVRLPIS